VNSHVILEEFINNQASIHTDNAKNNQNIFMLSAKSKTSLQELLQEWHNYIKTESFSAQSLHDINFTLMQGRESFEHRFGILVNSKSDLSKAIETYSQETRSHLISSTELKDKIVLSFKPLIDFSYSSFYEICQQFPVLA